jgi:hypothetical protein
VPGIPGSRMQMALHREELGQMKCPIGACTYHTLLSLIIGRPWVPVYGRDVIAFICEAA